jgi:hypothetical protein
VQALAFDAFDVFCCPKAGPVAASPRMIVKVYARMNISPENEQATSKPVATSENPSPNR